MLARLQSVKGSNIKGGRNPRPPAAVTPCPSAAAAPKWRCFALNPPLAHCPPSPRPLRPRPARARSCRAAAPRHTVAFFGLGGGDDDDDGYAGDEITVAKLQVGVFGKVEEFKRELDKVASLMDTEDDGAMQELVQGALRARGMGWDAMRWGPQRTSINSSERSTQQHTGSTQLARHTASPT